MKKPRYDGFAEVETVEVPDLQALDKNKAIRYIEFV